MLAAGVSLSVGLGLFKTMFQGEPSEVLRALGYFEDGDLPSLGAEDKYRLRRERDRVRDLPSLAPVVHPLSREVDDR